MLAVNNLYAFFAIFFANTKHFLFWHRKILVAPFSLGLASGVAARRVRFYLCITIAMARIPCGCRRCGVRGRGVLTAGYGRMLEWCELAGIKI
jgi:hypothetical protein